MDRFIKWIGGALPSSPYLGQETPPNQINRHPGEIHLSRPIKLVDVESPLVHNELVEKSIQLYRIKRGVEAGFPKNTDDLKIEMMSVFNKTVFGGQTYVERVWWLQIGHPYVPFIESVIAMRVDSRWEKLGVVGSSRLGIACVYTDETINCMLRELLVMFKNQHYELEDLLDEDYDDEEGEEETSGPLNSIILNVEETEKKPTGNDSYSVFGNSLEGAKKAD